MTPLEAARQIAELGPPLHEDAWCAACQRVIVAIGGIEARPHADFCPWLHMPQIVKALEAAAEVVEDWRENADGPADYVAMTTLRRALKGGD